jgi:hypothetical protein
MVARSASLAGSMAWCRRITGAGCVTRAGVITGAGVVTGTSGVTRAAGMTRRPVTLVTGMAWLAGVRGWRPRF